ncbi:DUF551 domain-containing protein [Raoultella ornithinolytica]|uniref:DUF551 domain-containing protein n=1 Tax=Raoultella ornithinolytica TaxID=54291 RepID=UPI001398812A|nr:DUF551 domain-containing protein [Raoultella ornithinolytica]QHW68675.1 DUF551 domain-containing protein [Raoultella ornithinolytica]
MTSKFTREELLNIIETDHVQCGEASALARMALAAMDSEPVATLDVQSRRPDGNKFALVFSSAAHKLPDDVYFLYRHAQPAPELKPVGYIFVSGQGAIAYSPTDWGMPGFKLAGQIFGDIDVESQPAPVVPDENVSFHRLPGESEYDRLNRQREWMESKSKLAKVTAAAPDDLTERLLRLRAQATLDGSYLDTEEWDSLACDVIKALNACRAAMLQAGNSPVIPEWIPVSEQMPEDRTQVILWDAEIGEVTSGHYSHKTQTFYHCGDAIENEITHWMPMPAAPQEGNS